MIKDKCNTSDENTTGNNENTNIEYNVVPTECVKTESDVWTKIMMLALIFVVGGIFGFVYEEIFYRIDLGYFVKRGTTLGPWIPIYGFGALLITLSTYKLTKKPWLVLIVGGSVCGIIEFISGYIFYHKSQLRLWDYNNEIWNWGNIGGYICIRSVLFFALSSLILMYIIIPMIKRVESRLNRTVFSMISIISALLFFADFFAANALKLY